jgi:integrase
MAKRRGAGIHRLTERRVASAIWHWPKGTKGTAATFLSDGGGLYLRVATYGSKSFVFRYMVRGRARDMGLGPVHTVSLAEARQAALDARKLLRAGKDPIEERRRAKGVGVTFEAFAREYIETQAAKWSESHQGEWAGSLSNHVFPAIGRLPVAAIDTPAIQRAIGRLWEASPEQGRRTLNRIRTVLDAAGAAGYRDAAVPNPGRWRGHLEHLMPAVAKGEKNHPSLPYRELPAFMAGLREIPFASCRMMEYLILTVARASEARLAKWSEIDFEGRQWLVPAGRMKAAQEHLVPLSGHALAILKALPRDGEHVFMNRGRPFGETVFEVVLQKHMKRTDVTTHGFRATFATWAQEVDGTPRDVREMALAHKERDRTERAYARSALLEQRRALADRWAAFCDGRVGPGGGG